MLTPLDFLQDLFNPQLAFLPKALVVATFSALVCAVVGTHVVLRGMTFMGDAISHAVFPGLAVAFVLQGSLLWGGLIAGVVTAVLIAVLSQNERLRSDTVIGILMVTMFAIGIVVMSRAPGYSGSLSTFLFGSLTGIPDSALVTTVLGSMLILAVLAVFHRDLVMVGLDRGYATAIGMRVMALDIVLAVVVTFAVVMSVQTIGNILVIALLVTPAAAARMVCDRMVPMMLTAACFGVLGAFVGIYVSWAVDLPTGGAVVLVCAVIFVLAWLLGPRHGVLARQRGVRERGVREQNGQGRVRAGAAATDA